MDDNIPSGKNRWVIRCAEDRNMFVREIRGKNHYGTTDLSHALIMGYHEAREKMLDGESLDRFSNALFNQTGRYRLPKPKPEASDVDVYPFELQIETYQPQEKQPVSQTVNKNLFALLSNDVELIDVWMPGKTGEERRTYTFKALKAMNLKEGDKVVVAMQHPDLRRPSVLVKTVRAVRPAVEMDDSISYKWVQAKVDFALYELAAKKEAEFIEKLVQLDRENQLKKVRDQMAERYGADNIAVLTDMSHIDAEAVPTLDAPNA